MSRERADVRGGAANPASAGANRLAREMDGRGLAATLFNAVVGAGIFLLPAAAAAELGAAAPLAYVLAALVVGLVVLVFAEAGSRVPSSGGPYAFVEVGLGRYAGFLAGLLLWTIGTFATAAVANGFIGHLPGLRDPVARAAGLTALFAALAAVNVRGVRRGALLVEAATVIKLLPLLAFVIVGAFFVSPGRLALDEIPPATRVAATAGLLIFAFGGMESGLAPSGEVRDPARTVPRALFAVTGAVAVFYVAIQLVAQGILGADLPRASAAPLAVAAARVVGPAGAAVLAAGAAVAMFGTLSGMTLATPRLLYALAADGFAPRVLRAVHPRHRTPHVAIAAQAALALALALSGSFRALAGLAGAGVLVLYLLSCAAAVALRRRDVRTAGAPFRSPGGSTIPLLASIGILGVLANVPPRDLLAVGAVLAAGSLLYAAGLRRRTRPRRSP